jgi:phosphoglycerate dehydrogenase-like enzyme
MRVHYSAVDAADVLSTLRPLLKPTIALTGSDAWLSAADAAAAPASLPVRVLICGYPSRDMLRTLVAQAKAARVTPALLIPWAGVPAATATYVNELRAADESITVHNIHHNHQSVAEYALALVLALMRRIVPSHAAMLKGTWVPAMRNDGVPATDTLHDKRVLILGHGHIGRSLARRLAGFEVRSIKATRLSIANRYVDDFGVEVFPSSRTADLMRDCDVLFVCLPGVSSTKGLVGEREIALLPPNAVIVNVGRGVAINQAALFGALQAKRIAGAALDVWYNYPTPDMQEVAYADFPFHTLDNVVLSPHVASKTAAADAQRYVEVANLLNAAVGESDSSSVVPIGNVVAEL